MKNIKLSLVLAFFALVLFTFASCEKQESLQVDENTLTDIEIAEDAFDLTSVEEVTNFVEGLKSEDYKKTFECLEVTVHENENGQFWPHSVTISFGDSCVGPDGNIFKGKIHVTQSAYWKTQGATRTTTFEDFSINNYKVEGTKVLTTNGLNENQNLSFTRTITNGKITTPDGTASITHNSTRTWELVEGFGTDTFLDNVYEITGTANGTTWTGGIYSKTITVPLTKSAVCLFPSSGKVELILNSQEPIILDYGDGTCDAKATLTRGDQVKEIILGNRFRGKNK
jgi:hypothetical protein